jgi:catechol 2,3-dioxygenase-like lactoylglutathione lyase family enzyme
MIHGVHLLLYSRDAEADRAFLRDVLGFASVDAGHGWLIFGLPPAELAVHPSDGNVAQNAVGESLAASVLYLMCDDLAATIASLNGKGAATTEVKEERWGTVTTVRLPSGAGLGLYQPRHATALHLAGR